MEIFQLRYLVAVAEKLNFTRAAESLNVSQSAMSRQIQQLEMELGVKLFHRNRQRVVITDEGRVLLRYAGRILSEVSVMTQVAGDLAANVGGDICIGCDWRVFFSVIPDTIAEFRRQNPQAHVTIRELPPPSHAEALSEGKIHISFTPSELITNTGPFCFQKVLASDLVVIVSVEHKLAGESFVPVSRLRNETWLLDDRLPRTYRGFIKQICRRAGFSPILGRTGSGVEDILSMVAAGYGISILPRYIMAKYRDISSVRILSTDCEPIELCVVWLKENKSRILQEFLEILKRKADFSGK